MRRQESLERTKKRSTSNLSRSSQIQSQHNGDFQGSAMDISLAVPKDSHDIETERYSSGSCGNPRKSSCSGEGCCTVLERSVISTNSHAEDSFPKLRCSTSLNSQEKQHYNPRSDHISNVQVIARDTVDVEKGPGVVEYVILSVQGMTCTGCETKLFKSLSSINSVTKLQTSFVLSRAEFDIDTTAISLNDTIAQLERMTGFKCESITVKDQELDVLTAENPNALLDQPLPPGATNMCLIDDKTIRIYYNAELLGARDLLRKASVLHFSLPLFVPTHLLPLETSTFARSDL
jgi:Cd2+-exporting ATPase